MPNKGGKQRFCSVPKTLSQQPESGYLFSCLISCLHGYKVGHEKQINKVLLTVSRYTYLFKFCHGGHKQKTC